MILHHILGILAVTASIGSHAGHYYSLLVLLTEMTTPLINLRWWGVLRRRCSNTYEAVNYDLCRWLDTNLAFDK